MAAPGQTASLDALLPAFDQLTSRPAQTDARGLDQILDVNCSVTAELGRLQVSIGEVLKLSPGSVLELDRLVSEPVDLVIQGVKFARGEVVVVDDHFAIRIKEILDTKKRA